jgi:hypothetical protein
MSIRDILIDSPHGPLILLARGGHLSCLYFHRHNRRPNAWFHRTRPRRAAGVGRRPTQGVLHRHHTCDATEVGSTAHGFSSRPQQVNGLTNPVPCATMTTRVEIHILACTLGIAA